MKEDFVELDFNYSIYIQFFIGLVAVVNPFGVLPIFVGMTTNQYEAQRNKTNLVMCISVAVILLTSLYLGQIILNIFSISLNSFRIAGGILIVSIAMSMISGKLGEQKQNKERIAVLKDYVIANENIVEVYKSEFESGTRTFVDILDAQTVLYEAKKSLVSREYELYTNYYDILNTYTYGSLQ